MSGYIALKARVTKSASTSLRGGESVIRLLLLLPFIGLMSCRSTTSGSRLLFGFPFFYWYQLAWVPLTVAPDLDRLQERDARDD